MTVEDKLQSAKKVVMQLRAAGYQAYIVGGCVRDMLLKRPVEEIDLVSNASTDQVLQLFPDSRLVGNVFPVVQVKVSDVVYEIAAFRAEDTNEQTLNEQDAQKRDFTCNSLFYDPETEEVLDTVGGQEDLKNGLIRFNGCGEERIAEDPCRMLRGIRLAVQYGFEIEAATFKVIIEQAAAIQSISAERLFLELEKIWMSESPDKGLCLLSESGLLPYILPEVDALRGVEQPEHYHPEGDVFEHTCKALHHMIKPVSRYLAWAIVFHDIGKPKTQTFEDRIHFKGHEKAGEELAQIRLQELHADNKLIQAVRIMIRYHGQFHHIQQMKKSTLKRMFSRETFHAELALHYADKMAGNQDLQYYDYAITQQEQLGSEDSTMERAFDLINGHDLEDLGFIPGPLFRHVLKDIRDAYLENTIKKREEALEMAKVLLEKYRNN